MGGRRLRLAMTAPTTAGQRVIRTNELQVWFVASTLGHTVVAREGRLPSREKRIALSPFPTGRADRAGHSGDGLSPGRPAAGTGVREEPWRPVRGEVREPRQEPPRTRGGSRTCDLTDTRT